MDLVLTASGCDLYEYFIFVYTFRLVEIREQIPACTLNSPDYNKFSHGEKFRRTKGQSIAGPRNFSNFVTDTLII